MKLHEIWEQNVVFDGKPDFMPGSLVMGVLNHKAYGGSKQDLAEAKETGEMDTPKRYKVYVMIHYEEVE